MKKIASVLVVLMYLIPAFSTVNAEVVNKDVEIDRINITKCNLSLIENINTLDLKDSKVKYIDFSIVIDPEKDGYCEITLNGTIETDIGTVTFEDFTMRVKGDDCTELALRILESFRQN